MRRVFGYKLLCFNSLRAYLAVVASALVLVSCSGSVTGPSGLSGVWKLQSMELPGTAPFVPEDPDRFTVVFLDTGRVGVTADCNQCGGTYSASDEAVSVSPLACTLILCATPHGAQFAGLIDGRSRLEASSPGQLLLQSSEGRVTLRH
jgi:heat shock protein HslJ